MNISIAIDGPAGAGKSTIAKILANKLNLMYINTGLMYRAITFIALAQNITPEDIENLCDTVDKINMHFEGDHLIVNGEDLTDKLHDPEINRNVAYYSSIPEIRERLVFLQRAISKKYDVIMDGRDIGTVVLKDATYKFFLTASPEERANRRYVELKSKGLDITFEEVLSDQLDRDLKDTTRKVNPLTKANDAMEIDTSNKSIEIVIDEIFNIISQDLSYKK